MLRTIPSTPAPFLNLVLSSASPPSSFQQSFETVTRLHSKGVRVFTISLIPVQNHSLKEPGMWCGEAAGTGAVHSLRQGARKDSAAPTVSNAHTLAWVLM